MTRVSTAEFIKNYGTLADKALREPVTITKNGKDRLVVMSAEEFAQMRSSYRRAIPIEGWTDEDMAQMDRQLSEAAKSGDGSLDAELVGWTP